MISRVLSACPVGVEAVPIVVETDVREAKPRISIVGLPDLATKESRDRLIPAITNSGFALNLLDIVINLSPADLRKEGAAYDLPMAIGVLAAQGLIPTPAVEGALFLGELALDGRLLPVKSVLASAECAREQGCHTLVVPVGNGKEASLVEDLTIMEAPSLAAVSNHLKQRVALFPYVRRPEKARRQDLPDFREVKGQTLAKRALEIAAAGNHCILLYGPPGSGKSMLSKRLGSILPQLSRPEMVEVTRIYSAAGLLNGNQDLASIRPFRAPHHTASPISLIGGGTYPRPGEVTLAHRGVLFLDELPEFPRHVLEVLRQPLEDKRVTVSRVANRITFPSDFLLVAAMNPCPCGWRGDRTRPCDCSGDRIRQYRGRISGPLLDRIDLQVEVPATPLRKIRQLPPAESSDQIRRRVCTARARQARRFGNCVQTNGSMPPKDLQRFCRLSDSLAEMLVAQAESWGLSTRAHDKLLRIARTIADLEGKDDIEQAHLLESFQYRQMERTSKAGFRQAAEEVTG